MGAVGPSHYVQLINGRYSAFQKSDGVKVQTATLQQFFNNAGVPNTGFAFDPRVIYDHGSQRWFALAGENTNQPGNYLFAVSISSDPTMGWTGFRIDSDTDNGQWADYPMIGWTPTRLHFGQHVRRPRRAVYAC